MRLGTRKTLFGMIAAVVAMLVGVILIGVRQYDGSMKVLETQERCVAIARSANPAGADDAERSQLATCRAEGWTPPQ